MTQPLLTANPSLAGLASDSSGSSALLSSSELARAERVARRWWVSAIVGLLGLQVLIGVGSILLAVSDPTVAIVPNYHQKALDWDVSQRAAHLTGKLGWTVTPMVSERSPDSAKRLVRVQVRDRFGQLVRDLQLSAKAFHHARGSEIYDMKFIETETGNYEAMTSLTDPGMWQLYLQIEGNHGLASDTRDMMVE